MKEKLINDDIKFQKIMLISNEGISLGEFSRKEALKKAGEAELDLVLISSNGENAVCKICNASKYFYAIEKNTKKVTSSVIKEIKFRVKTDTNDIKVKCNNIRRILNDGDRVKVIINLRRKEKESEDLIKYCKDTFAKILEELGNFVKIDNSEDTSIIISIKK